MTPAPGAAGIRPARCAKRCSWLMLLATVTNAAGATEAGYTAEINRWRQDFDADIRTGGWLTSVGRFEVPEGASTLGSGRTNAMRLAPMHARKAMGVLTRAGRSFSFTLSRGVRATLDGKSVGKRFQLSIDTGKGKVRIGSLELMVRALGDDYYLTIADLDSPAIAKFRGSSWFAIDEALRVPATFVAYDKPEEVRIPMTHIEWQKPMTSTGDVVFTLNGQTLRLKSFLDGEDLFIMFTDPTNGVESYGGGRFIEAPLPKNGMTTLDFNKAFSPYCSLNAYVMCPIPPPENRLELRITAGEKYVASEN